MPPPLPSGIVVTSLCGCTQLLEGARDLNSGPCACPAGTGPTEPTSQLCVANSVSSGPSGACKVIGCSCTRREQGGSVPQALPELQPQPGQHQHTAREAWQRCECPLSHGAHTSCLPSSPYRSQAGTDLIVRVRGPLRVGTGHTQMPSS